MTNLKELLERVKAATEPDRELDKSISSAMGWNHSPPQYTASVDAALAFAERVLPGWEWLKKSPGVITLYRPLTEQEDAANAWAKHFDATGATLPLAIIAATLTALIAQEDSQ